MSNQADKWQLTVMQVVVTVAKPDGRHEELIIPLLARSWNAETWIACRIIPTWTAIAGVDTHATDPKTHVSRLIKAGDVMSVEDTPTFVECEKPDVLVHYEKEN